MIVILTFVLSFGISLQSIVSPKERFSIGVLREIINIAYWPIYGELSILERLNGNDCEKDPNDCLDPLSVGFAFVILMIYMVFANVLLLNLLIAAFRFLLFQKHFLFYHYT